MHPAPLETGSADPVLQCAFPFDRAYVLAACLVSSAENFSELVSTRPDSWAKAGFVVKKSGEAEGRYLALVVTLRVLHGWPGGDVLQDVKTSKSEWFHLFDGLDSGSYANATSTKAVRVSKR